MNNAQLSALRSIGSKVSYPVTLTFTREFTAGPLAGATHEDSLGFCSVCDAAEWVSTVNGANARGKLNYRVTKWATR